MADIWWKLCYFCFIMFIYHKICFDVHLLFFCFWYFTEWFVSFSLCILTRMSLCPFFCYVHATIIVCPILHWTLNMLIIFFKQFILSVNLYDTSHVQYHQDHIANSTRKPLIKNEEKQTYQKTTDDRHDTQVKRYCSTLCSRRIKCTSTSISSASRDELHQNS